MITESACSNMKIKTEIVSDDENCDQNNNNQAYGSGDGERDYAKIAENRTATARKLLSIIKKGDFDELVLLLNTKPDLNVFINGQTALHHCLLLGMLTLMKLLIFPSSMKYLAISIISLIASYTEMFDSKIIFLFIILFS